MKTLTDLFDISHGNKFDLWYSSSNPGPPCGQNPRRKRAHPQRPPVKWFTSWLAQRGTRPQEVEDGQGGRVRAHPTGASH
jgi:hypothetical protein